jgi:hypothetical protein
MTRRKPKIVPPEATSSPLSITIDTAIYCSVALTILNPVPKRTIYAGKKNEALHSGQLRSPTASVRPASGCTTPFPQTATPFFMSAVRKVNSRA